MQRAEGRWGRGDGAGVTGAGCGEGGSCGAFKASKLSIEGIEKVEGVDGEVCVALGQSHVH